MRSTAKDILGSSYFPSILFQKQGIFDGIVLDFRTMPGGGCRPKEAPSAGVDFQGDCENEKTKDSCCKYAYDKGKTLVHEVG